jgi:hypothetical protein
MKDSDVSVAELIASCEQSQFEFLREDSELCLTFADLAKTRFGMGLRVSACEARSKAEVAYAAIARFVPHLKALSHRREVNKRLDRLRATLDQLGVIESTYAPVPKTSGTDASVENACMRFIPGTHHLGHLTCQLSENDEANVLNQADLGLSRRSKITTRVRRTTPQDQDGREPGKPAGSQLT